MFIEWTIFFLEKYFLCYHISQMNGYFWIFLKDSIPYTTVEIFLVIIHCNHILYRMFNYLVINLHYKTHM